MNSRKTTEYINRLYEVLGKHDSVNLAIGEPDFGPPPALLEAWKEHVEVNAGYTPISGLPLLRQRIKDKLRVENHVRAEKVVVTAGSAEAIFDTMLAHVSPESEVILFSPCYRKYAVVADCIGARVRRIPLVAGRPPVAELEHYISEKTGMVVVNSPSNPTGAVYSREELKHLAEIVDAHEVVLLSDEAYEKYVYGGRTHHSPGKFSDRALTIQSFSKTYGFPGLRLGYVAGSQKLVEPVLDVHASNTTCCPYAAQQAAVKAMEGPCPVDVSSFDERRRLVLQFLDRIEADYIYPEGAFYVYVYTPGDSLRISTRLMERGILVMPHVLFGGERDAIRISYAIRSDILERGIRQVMRYLRTNM